MVKIDQKIVNLTDVVKDDFFFIHQTAAGQEASQFALPAQGLGNAAAETPCICIWRTNLKVRLLRYCLS